MQVSRACAQRARLLLVVLFAAALAACETMPSAIEPISAPDARAGETSREVRLDAADRIASLTR
jgi:hypothetical protein